MSTELVIYGAAYGRTDVTGHVRKLRKDQKLTVKASNDVFGDSWPDHQKSLVVVYKYDNGPTAEVQQKVVKEGKTLVLSPPKSPAGIAKDRLSLALKSGMLRGVPSVVRLCGQKFGRRLKLQLFIMSVKNINIHGAIL